MTASEPMRLNTLKDKLNLAVVKRFGGVAETKFPRTI